MSNILPIIFQVAIPSAAAAFNVYAGISCLRGYDASTKLVGVGILGLAGFMGLNAAIGYDKITSPPPPVEFNLTIS